MVSTLEIEEATSAWCAQRSSMEETSRVMAAAAARILALREQNYKLLKRLKGHVGRMYTGTTLGEWKETTDLIAEVEANPL